MGLIYSYDKLKKWKNISFGRSGSGKLTKFYRLFGYNSFFWEKGYEYTTPATDLLGFYEIKIWHTTYSVRFFYGPNDRLENVLLNIQKALNGYDYDDSIITQPPESPLPAGIVAVSHVNTLTIRAATDVDYTIINHGGLPVTESIDTSPTKNIFHKVYGIEDETLPDPEKELTGFTRTAESGELTDGTPLVLNVNGTEHTIDTITIKYKE